MFDRVGDVNFITIDTRIGQRSVEYFSGRPNERFSRQVLLIAGLLPEQK